MWKHWGRQRSRQGKYTGIGKRECAAMGIFAAAALFSVLGNMAGNRPKNNDICYLNAEAEQKAVLAESRGRKEQKDKGQIALTFDDGPHPYYTAQLLDGLKERGVHVTFFVTGEHASLHPDIIRRMQEEGHLIGNHTYSHMQLTRNNREKFKEQLVKTNEAISKITGEDVLYVRPPYGSWDKSFEKELNMFPVFWSVDPLDWCSSDAARIANRVIRKVQENDIILMHDYYAASVTAALAIVDELTAQGYAFVTVEEILFD